MSAKTKVVENDDGGFTILLSAADARKLFRVKADSGQAADRAAAPGRAVRIQAPAEVLRAYRNRLDGEKDAESFRIAPGTAEGAKPGPASGGIEVARLRDGFLDGFVAGFAALPKAVHQTYEPARNPRPQGTAADWRAVGGYLRSALGKFNGETA